LPAAGQGALGIEVRADRQDLIDALALLAHQPTWLAVTAERTVSRAIGGSCSMPLAAFTRGPTADCMRLDAAWGDPGSVGPDAVPSAEPKLTTPLVRVQHHALVRDFAEAQALGEHVAALLRAGGAVWATNASLDTSSNAST
jgi:hydroxymethylbilane synthase